MSTGQPPTAELRDHYRQLVRTRALDVAMCWTVIVSDARGARLTPAEIAARISGNTPYRLHPAIPFSDLWQFLDGGDYPVLVDWHGAAAMIIEFDYLGSSAAVLKRLSLSQWPQLEATTDIFIEFEERSDGYDWRAAWLALIEQTTGVRLTGEWLDQTHWCVTVNMAEATR